MVTEFAVRAARDIIRAARTARELWWRQPSLLIGDPLHDGPPSVYYLSPDPRSPAGGVRVIYRHVDLLNAAGIPAAVVHENPGFRCSWFANETRVLSVGDIVVGPRDILVVPEVFGPGLWRLTTIPSIVVFNQGAYHTFDAVPFSSTVRGEPYSNLANLVALLTVSEDSVDLLDYTFPHLPVHLAPSVVDGHVFHPGSAAPKRRIAFTTTRRPEEREHLLHILRCRGLLDAWELAPITGLSEAGVAEVMRDCALFLSFSEREGFGLPAAEAMASGCYVVGYPGQGGRDFFDPEYCVPVADGDILAFARAVEEAMAVYDADPALVENRGRLASRRVLERYTVDRLRNDLVGFYEPLRASRRRVEMSPPAIPFPVPVLDP